MGRRHNLRSRETPDSEVAALAGAATTDLDLAQVPNPERSGSPRKVVKGDAAADRFWAKVDRRGERDCWLWLGKTNGHYGYFHLGRGQLVGAHRVAVMLDTGEPLPPGMVVHHVCRSRLCVNPRHLRVGSQAENVMRDTSPPAVNAHKTECIHGHPFTPENTRIYTRPMGGVERVCVACERRRNEAKRVPT